MLANREALSDRWLTMRLLWTTSAGLSIAAVGCVLVGVLLPVGFTLAAGKAADAVGTAARSGLSIERGRSLVRAIVVVGGVFVVQQTLIPIREGVVDLLARRFRSAIFRRAMIATLVPATIAHLEDPEFKDRISKVEDVSALGPRAAVQGLAGQGLIRLGGLANLGLVARQTPVCALLLLAALVHQQRRYRDGYRQLTETVWRGTQHLRRSSYLHSVATGPDAAKEVRLFGLGLWVVEQYRDAWFHVMEKLWAGRRRNWANVLKATLPVVLVGATGMALVARDAAAGNVGIGALVIYVQGLVGSLNLAGLTDWDAYVSEGVRVVRSLDDLEHAISSSAALESTGCRSPAGLPAQGLRFEQVRFRYPGSQVDVFTDLDLELPAGTSLAIVGLNGAGKTTLIKLLARLYDPTSGRITVDDVDLREIDPRAWQRRISAIFQDFHRYQLTARENVAFGAVERMQDRLALERAAHAAGILEVIEGLPHGWDTTLGRQWEGGTDISGGEWQRIALARALFAADAGAGVLVLDEPTAQLDVRAEASFYERFLELTAGLTTIVISHRLSTVRRADRIILLEHGSVVEQGSHDELVAQAGRYAAMFELQARRFSDG